MTDAMMPHDLLTKIMRKWGVGVVYKIGIMKKFKKMRNVGFYESEHA